MRKSNFAVFLVISIALLSTGVNAEKLVFVSSGRYNGSLGNFVGADAKCQQLANVANIPGLTSGSTFMTWLSNDTLNAKDRLTHWTNNYVLRDGTVVANGWNDLVDGTLDHAINIDEKGNACTGTDYDMRVWTGTDEHGEDKFTGSGDSYFDCLSWTTNATVISACVGMCNNADVVGWTYYTCEHCDKVRRIYCFQESGTFDPSATTTTTTTTTSIPPPPIPGNGTTTTTSIPSPPPDNGTTTTITTTTTIANCHTKPLWDWSYCTSTCKCNAGEGDCETDAECNTGYCAQNVGTKYRQSSDMDVCENRVTTTTISVTTITIIGSTTTTRVSGSSTTTRQTTTTTKSTGKMINISISSCKDALCKQNSRYFILNATIFLKYNSSLKDISLEANLVYPDGTSEEISIPASIKAEQIGNHTLEVTASKQGYSTITKTVKFSVFKTEAEIPKDASEWNIIDIAIAAAIAAGLIAGYWYWKRRENKKVVKIIKRKNTEKLMRMLRKRK